MRPLVAMATFVVLLALTQVSAQHGGGHASAGGHGGMAGHGGFSGHAGFAGHSGGQGFSGTHSGFSGVHSGSGFAGHPSARGSSHQSLSHQSFSHQSFSSRNFNQFRGPHHRGPRIRTHGFRNDCFGFGCGGGWGYPYYPYLGGGIDPYWWWNSGSSYDEDREREIGLANEMNAQSLEEQRMHDQADQDAYASSDPAPAREQERTEAAPATVLVFRD